MAEEINKLTSQDILSESSVQDLVSVFFNLQEQRVEIYRKWEDSFKTFLLNKDLPLYQRTCATITSLFSTISIDIRGVEGALSKKGKADLAQIIVSIQQKERDKLQFTTERQVLKTSWIIDQNGLDVIKSDSLENNSDLEIKDGQSEFEEKLTVVEKKLSKLEADIYEKIEELRLESEE